MNDVKVKICGLMEPEVALEAEKNGADYIGIVFCKKSKRCVSIEDSLKSLDYGQLFIPPGVKPTMVFPQFNGGTDWGGAAYDINDRMIYVYGFSVEIRLSSL